MIFFGAWFAQSVTGWTDFNDAQRLHGEATVSWLSYVGSDCQFCESTLAGVDDSRLHETVAYFGEQTSRAAVMVSAAEEWAGHYSQIAIYLRLNGLVPPTAKPRAAQS